MTPVGSARGFSLLEMLVAAAIVLAITGTMVELARAARGASSVIGDMADVQQKMRVAADAIQHDLLIAGAGSETASGMGPLASYLPPIRPAAGLSGDSDITYAPDRISLLSVPDTHAEAEVTGPSGTTGGIAVGNTPVCAVLPTCGFQRGMHAIVFDRTGPGFGYDVFTVADASPGVVSKPSDEGGFSRVYSSTAHVSEVVLHTYHLDRSDPSNVRLMRGDGRSDFPLVDGVRELRFTYYADPDPASVSAAGADAGTCVYAPGPPPRPLLAVLGGTSLTELQASDLTDGPLCGMAPNRFDADLLRIRRVRVHLKVQPSPSARPSFELVFDVAPRNLNLSR